MPALTIKQIAARHAKLTSDLADWEAARREIGPLVRSWREGKAWTLTEVATRLKITKAYLSDIERGNRLVTEDLLRRLGEL